ncbi:MAG: nuclease-related domain-containing protein [Victivallales bacterium]
MIRKLLFGNKDSRPPFLKAPLALPGERVREKLEDEVMGFAIALSIPIFLILLVIYKTIFSAPLSHNLSFLVHSITTVPFFLFFYIYGKKKIKNIRTYRLGFIGEQVIGQELERARSMGYTVFHDIYSDEKKFNVDHIAIGKAGIVVVETKAKSKPKKGSPEIKYDGKSIIFPDKSYTVDPLDQVERNSTWIQELAHKLIADERKPICQFNIKNPVPVVCVVVYPGWHIDYTEAQRNKAPVIVTNEQMLVDSVIKSLKQPVELTDGMVEELQDLFDYHLREKNKRLIEY